MAALYRILSLRTPGPLAGAFLATQLKFPALAGDPQIAHEGGLGLYHRR